jgi:hypothetical protein
MEVRFMIVFRLLLALVMILVLGACDTAGETAGSSSVEADSTEADSTEEVSTDAPGEEGTGPENPRPTEEDMSVTLPQLPVGGGSDGEPEDQCVTASFNLSLSDGVSVAVTGIRFSADGASVTGGGCDGSDSCEGFTFTSEESTCTVSVDASEATTDIDLFLDGKCFAEDRSACEDLKGNTGSVSLRVPERSPEETTTTDDEQPPDPTE